MNHSEFDIRLGFSYSLGVYLAINALPDALLVMDGVDCTVQMASQIQGNHDWQSNLISADGAHRILTTHAMPEEVWQNREKAISDVVSYALGRSDSRVIFLGAIRMASITEPPYELILDACAEQTGTEKPLILLPTRSLVDDWLTGYDNTLEYLAKYLPLEPRQGANQGRVAIVGYLMDRNEEDHFGNLRELERLIEGIGGTLVCTWLSGKPTTHLAKIGQADVVISLPYARNAAKILANRTGAALVETELPIGLEGTRTWLETVARALGTQRAAEAFVHKELSQAATKLEAVVSLVSRDMSLALMGEPYLVRGLLGLARELGIPVPLRAIVSAVQNDGQDWLQPDPLDDPITIVDPKEGQLQEPLRVAIEKRGVNLVVATSYVLQDLVPPVAAFELGFPSFHSHALTDQPFMGFRGCLSLVARWVERQAWHHLLRDLRPIPSNG